MRRAPDLTTSVADLGQQLLDPVLRRFERSDQTYREEEHGSSAANSDIIGVDDDRQPSRIGGGEGDRIRGHRPQLAADLDQCCVFAGRRPELDLRRQVAGQQIGDDVPGNLARRQPLAHRGIIADQVDGRRAQFELESGIRNAAQPPECRIEQPGGSGGNSEFRIHHYREIFLICFLIFFACFLSPADS